MQAGFFRLVSWGAHFHSQQSFPDSNAKCAWGGQTGQSNYFFPARHRAKRSEPSIRRPKKNQPAMRTARLVSCSFGAIVRRRSGALRAFFLSWAWWPGNWGLVFGGIFRRTCFRTPDAFSAPTYARRRSLVGIVLFRSCFGLAGPAGILPKFNVEHLDGECWTMARRALCRTGRLPSPFSAHRWGFYCSARFGRREKRPTPAHFEARRPFSLSRRHSSLVALPGIVGRLGFSGNGWEGESAFSFHSLPGSSVSAVSQRREIAALPFRGHHWRDVRLCFFQRDVRGIRIRAPGWGLAYGILWWFLGAAHA